MYIIKSVEVRFHRREKGFGKREARMKVYSRVRSVGGWAGIVFRCAMEEGRGREERKAAVLDSNGVGRGGYSGK